MNNCLLIFGDRAFQYCKRLETVIIGNGNIEMGKYVFSGCADNLTITVAGEKYNADAIKEGLKYNFEGGNIYGIST